MCNAVIIAQVDKAERTEAGGAKGGAWALRLSHGTILPITHWAWPATENELYLNDFTLLYAMSGLLKSCQVSITECENLKYQGIHKIAIKKVL